MTRAIDDFCRRTEQPVPRTAGAYARAIMESLALKYRLVLEQLGRNDVPPGRRILDPECRPGRGTARFDRVLGGPEVIRRVGRDAHPVEQHERGVATVEPCLERDRQATGSRRHEEGRDPLSRPRPAGRARHYHEAVGDPDWRGMIPTFRRATPAELPNGYLTGYMMEVPVIEMPVYLPYLADRVKRLGGTVRLREIQSPD